MTHWLITYDYRLHRRCGTKENVGAILTDVKRGRHTEVIDTDPATWFLVQKERWERLEKERDKLGEAMTGIVVHFAVKQEAAQSAE